MRIALRGQDGISAPSAGVAPAPANGASAPAPAPGVRVPAPRAGGPRVWAVGGGKGGVGKSVVTASLGVALARLGQRCVLVDADLGGANLHTVLGVRKPGRNLSDFLSREVHALAEIVCRTPVPNLSLVSGARAFADAANPKHSQKGKLLRHIRSLDADHVLLDLSAGSGFNVLDFFLAAERRLLVVTPEPTSVENAYQFLKASLFRSLRVAARQSPVREAIRQVLLRSSQGRPRSARELVAAVAEIDPGAGALLEGAARRFRPTLLVNQAEDAEDRHLGQDMRIACREYLGVELDYAGALAADARVRESVERRKPVLDLFPESAFARDLRRLAGRLLGEAAAQADALVPAEPADCVGSPVRFSFDDPPLATYGLLPDEDEGPARREWLRALYRKLSAGHAGPPPLAAALEAPPGIDPDHPGTYLRRCREQLGLSAADLAQRTRIRNLESLEDERFEQLPPAPYVRGFVLEYARALGLANGETLASSYLACYQRALSRR